MTQTKTLKDHQFNLPTASRLGVTLILCLGLGACGMFGAKKADTGPQVAKGSTEALYKEAKEELNSGGFVRAIEQLEKVQAADALGIYGQQALLDTAYAQWRNGDGALGLVTTDRFLKQFPKGEGVPYALYLKGLINFNERSGLLSALTKEDLSERDPKSLSESFDAFDRLIKQYPDSKYSDEARQRLTYIVNTLAKHEMGIALFYLQRGAPLAAINRSQDMLKQYSQTPAQEEALGIMAEAYKQLNLMDLRESALRVLKQNYPNSRHLAGGIYNAPAKSWFKLW
jgi:outer membrane protein assembly factor BamD